MGHHIIKFKLCKAFLDIRLNGRAPMEYLSIRRTSNRIGLVCAHVTHRYTEDIIPPTSPCYAGLRKLPSW